jgi:type II secretory ATPase GspE/PulE/Tfp pilus assembly ATPase PilB-like protein
MKAKSEKDITRLVERIVGEAVASGATDIHLNPTESALVVRFRQDGILREVESLEGSVKESVVARIKVLSNLIVYKRNVPQDGRIVGDVGLAEDNIELRVTTFPTIHGEKVAIRIFDSRRVLLALENLGFSSKLEGDLIGLLDNPQGTLLLTGPSSSGKTTTIYATIEDPVEFDLKDVSQTQIEPALGLTFAAGLRSILRQDPEVIVIGEIRDTETAQIAIEAGLTGHLVISTIHCGQAVGVFTRLVEMEIEPFLVASSVTGVLSQRLVRLICSECVEEYVPAPHLLQEFGIGNGEIESFRHGTGCEHCNGAGYLGRTAIGELLVVTENIGDMILNRTHTSDLAREAEKQGREGRTTLEELYRVLMHKVPEGRKG